MDPLIFMSLTEENVYLRYLKMNSKPKRFGIHPINRKRTKFGEYHHLFPDLRKDKDKFFEYTRMSIDSFDTLLSYIMDDLSTKIRLPKGRYISPEHKLVVTLRFLITGNSFRAMAFSFRMGKTTIRNIVEKTCRIIWRKLQPEYMPVPSEEQLRQNIQDYYQRWHFPNCYGSIDGKHCRFKCPPKSGSTYFNYLKYFSVVLQGVADADKKFVTIDVGAFGRQHDATTFKASSLFRKLEAKEFNAPAEMRIPRTDIVLPTFLIADEAYPLTEYMMRPYSGKNLPAVKERFNLRLSGARKCIECAFGILVRKFEIFSKRVQLKPSLAVKIIKTACLLHNYIRCKDGRTDLDHNFMVRQIYDDNNDGNRRMHFAGRRNNASRAAKNTRDVLAQYFRNH